jgi:hypothetical protein
MFDKPETPGGPVIGSPRGGCRRPGGCVRILPRIAPGAGRTRCAVAERRPQKGAVPSTGRRVVTATPWMRPTAAAPPGDAARDGAPMPVPDPRQDGRRCPSRAGCGVRERGTSCAAIPAGARPSEGAPRTGAATAAA